MAPLESILQHVPPGTALPRLLEDFVVWFANRGSALGLVEGHGSRLDDFYVEDGSRAAHCFVGFLRCPDGSRIGLWRPDGQSLATAWVVLLGSQGDLQVLGSDLADFLGRWSRGAIPLDDLRPDRSSSAAGHQPLRSWLSASGISAASELTPLDHFSAELVRWFDAWSEERTQMARTSPTRRELTRALLGVLETPKEAWQRTSLDVFLSPTDCRIFRTFVGQRPVDVTPPLETGLRAFRLADCADLPEAGLWFRAALSLDFEQTLTVQRTYLERPDPSHHAFDVLGVRDELSQMPRIAYWLPRWLQVGVDPVWWTPSEGATMRQESSSCQNGSAGSSVRSSRRRRCASANRVTDRSVKLPRTWV